jgi:hypothetical protein
MFDRTKFAVATQLGRILLYIRTPDETDCPLSSVWKNLSDEERFGVIQLKQHLDIPLKEWEHER